MFIGGGGTRKSTVINWVTYVIPAHYSIINSTLGAVRPRALCRDEKRLCVSPS